MMTITINIFITIYNISAATKYTRKPIIKLLK